MRGNIVTVELSLDDLIIIGHAGRLIADRAIFTKFLDTSKGVFYAHQGDLDNIRINGTAEVELLQLDDAGDLEVIVEVMP